MRERRPSAWSAGRSRLRLCAALALLAQGASAAQGFRLNAPLVADGDVAEFALSPDGTRVVYLADQDEDEVFELFSASIEGGVPVQLSAPLVADGDVGGAFVHGFRVSPDGARVVYWADQDEDEVFELFSVPIDGSLAPVQLNGPLVAGGDVLFTPTFLPPEAFAPITPDGTFVLYVADEEQDEVFELYAAGLDGSQPPRKLSGALVAGGDVFLSAPPLGPNPFWPQLSPDGSRAVYRADQQRDEEIELYSAPVDGSAAPARLNPPLGDVFSGFFGPDAAWVFYIADRNLVGPQELFRVPVEGPPARAYRTDARDRLNLPLGSFERVTAVSIVPDGARVVYQANPTGGASQELFSVASDGGPSVRLSLLTDGEVFSHALAADGERIVYLAGTDCAFDSKLFSVPIDGSEDRIRISSLSALGYVAAYELAHDGRVVYTFMLAFPDTELHSAPLDGSAAPVTLNAAGTHSGAFRIAPGGREVVYLQSPSAGGPLELFAVPIDGSRPGRKLNAPMVAGGNVGHDLSRNGFAVTSAGRVVYLADQEVDEVVELYVSFLQRPVRRGR